MAGGTKQVGLVAWLVAFVVPPVAFVVPPAVVGGPGQQFLAKHPGWAVAIVVAYEAVVAVGGFFAVVARDVSSRWQARLADRIDLFLQRKAARFERRYREFVLGGLRFMDYKGLATVGPFTPELDAVFVNVSLIPRPPQQIGPGVLPSLADDRTGRRVLGDFLGREEPAVLAVVGGPGSGKTTLLRHAARQACLRKRSRRYRRITCATSRSCCTCATTPPPSSPSRPSRWPPCCGRPSARCARRSPRAGLSSSCVTGGAWSCSMALMRLPGRKIAPRCRRGLKRQVRQYPGNDFVITSRPQGYQSAPVEGAEIVQVCGFTASQAEAFVRGWYRAVERHSTGSAGPEIEATRQTRAPTTCCGAWTGARAVRPDR